MNLDFSPLADRRAYYAAAESWASDLQAALRASRRVAWIVAGFACFVAIAEAVALSLLAPLKTVVPYVVTVDRQTGFVELTMGLKPGPLSEDAAVTQAFLAQYVLARETFDVNDLQENYRKVAQWTFGPARLEYIHGMAAVNPDSPLAKYSRTTILQTVIKSISLLSRNSALVRFETIEHKDGVGAGESRSWVAVIGFRFSGEPMRMEERLINPLGFQVTSYRRDAESLTPTPVRAGGSR